MNYRRRATVMGALGASLLPLRTAHAQSAYPSRPLRLIVPFGAGGVTDIVSRVLAERMGDRLGQRVVVENQPGAGGIAAARTVIGASSDGHTLGVMSSGLAASVSLFKNLTYDPLKDFQMVALVGTFEAMFVVSPDSPYRSLGDFIKAARAQPGKLNIGNGLPGSSAHLAALLFASDAGINVQNISFRTPAESFGALARNEVQMVVEFFTALRGQLSEKRLVAIATSARNRSIALPDTPTVHESGVPGYDVSSWNGIYVSQGTSPAVVKTLNQTVRSVVDDPEVRKRFIDLGIDPRTSTPDELAVRLKADIDKWAKVVEAAGIPRQ
jgi:tripartite-type tricarboxylate transporter receptor subunit TctC